jgi:hypothetical protein
MNSNEPTHDARRDTAREDTKFCPSCGVRSATVVDSVFVEYGEWTGKAYEWEGDADVYRCAAASCEYAFANVTGIPTREHPEEASLLDPTSVPNPKTTNRGSSDHSRFARRSDS